MHFTTLFVLKNESLEDLSKKEIIDMFYERYCNGGGDNKPKRQYWCDSCKIGGRWCDILTAKRGIKGDRTWTNSDAPNQKGKFSIVQIKDLTEPLPRQWINSFATKSKIVLKNDEWTSGNVNEDEFNKMIDDIDNKKFRGVIALIDCHD